MRKMLNLKQIEIIKEYAVGMVFSDFTEYTYDTLMEELQNDYIPEDVLVYELFESNDPQQLIENIEEQYGILEQLATDLLKAGK